MELNNLQMVQVPAMLHMIEKWFRESIPNVIIFWTIVTFLETRYNLI